MQMYWGKKYFFRCKTSVIHVSLRELAKKAVVFVSVGMEVDVSRAPRKKGRELERTLSMNQSNVETALVV